MHHLTQQTVEKYVYPKLGWIRLAKYEADDKFRRNSENAKIRKKITQKFKSTIYLTWAWWLAQIFPASRWSFKQILVLQLTKQLLTYLRWGQQVSLGVQQLKLSCQMCDPSTNNLSLTKNANEWNCKPWEEN